MMETKGWIEFSPYFKEQERNEDHSWLAWMNICSIVDGADEVTEAVFGYSKRIIRENLEVQALAKDRGVPDNASEIVKMEIQKIRSFEKEYGKGEIFGYSVVSYDEIKRSALPIIANSCWAKLFMLVEEFKKIKSLRDDQLRLIVWFEW